MNEARLNQLLTFLAQTPDDSFVWYALATEYVSGGNDAEAARYFEQLTSHHPEYIGTYYHFGKLLERTGDPLRAETVYRTGIETAERIGDRHAGRELKEALLTLIGDEGEDDF